MSEQNGHALTEKRVPTALTGALIELGTSDNARQVDGRRVDPFIPELSGRQALRTYDEMHKNDAVVRSVLFGIETLIRQTRWWVEPCGERYSEQKAAQFLDECMDDMSDTWNDTIADILSMLPFGWSYHEIVYKIRGGNVPDPRKRSKFTDGLIGWRKLPIRAQTTLHKWEFGADIMDDSVRGMWQLLDAAAPVFIPIEKSLLFKTHPANRQPEGQSMLRGAYRPWYFKRRMEEIEGIGIERELAGLPWLSAPEGLDIWDENDDDMKKLHAASISLIRAIRENKADGLLTPGGWDFKLVSSGGRRQIDVTQVIERYDRRIAMTMLADFLLIGHESVGSYALADAKTNLWAVSIGAIMDAVAAVFNRFAVPRLFELNPRFPQDKLPTLRHGDLETPDLTSLGEFIVKMVQAGILMPGPEIEDYVRSAANLPPGPTNEEREAYVTEEPQETEDVPDTNGTPVPAVRPGSRESADSQAQQSNR